MSKGTGATDEQIEGAVDRRYGGEEHSDFTRMHDRVHMRWMARCLVPPTHRIVSVEDLKNLFSAASYDDMTDLPFTAEWTAMLGRIRALIEGATEGTPGEER